jgi:thiosulfate/3-mercaptopyruvate sulfurtransferase
VLALAHAGLGDARLYEGSWSEWIANSRRPVARGEEP